MHAQDAIALILGRNNTKAWENNGWIYVDSMKNINVFANLCAEIGGNSFEILHQETNPEILFGIRSSCLAFGGKKTICNVCRFKV
jgi:hypothetical protein